MATWLDKQIEELEIIVVKCMKLGKENQDGLRRTAPAEHKKIENRDFPIATSRISKPGGS
jgi:hypothetical protein